MTGCVISIPYRLSHVCYCVVDIPMIVSRLLLCGWYAIWLSLSCCCVAGCVIGTPCGCLKVAAVWQALSWCLKSVLQRHWMPLTACSDMWNWSQWIYWSGFQLFKYVSNVVLETKFLQRSAPGRSWNTLLTSRCPSMDPEIILANPNQHTVTRLHSIICIVFSVCFRCFLVCQLVISCFY